LGVRSKGFGVRGWGIGVQGKVLGAGVEVSHAEATGWGSGFLW